MKEYWETIQIVIAVFSELIVSFLGGYDDLLCALASLVVLDYFTGAISTVFGGNPTTEIGAREISRKVLIFVLVGVSHILDTQVLGLDGVLRTVTSIFYLSSAGLSIVRHAANLGLPVPIKLKDVMEQLYDRGENGPEQ